MKNQQFNFSAKSTGLWRTRTMASQWRRDNEDGPADLTMRYIGNSHFDVLIFNATATEIDYTLDDQLQVCGMEDNESDDDSVEIMDGFTKGEGSGSAHGVGGNRVGCTSSSLVKVESDQCPKKDGGVAENLVRANALKSENPLFTVTIHPSYIDGNDRVSIPWAIINYLPREGFTKDYNKGSILTVKLQVVDRLVMAPKRAKRGKCKAASEPEVVFDQLSAQKKVVDPSVSPSETPRVRSTTGDVPDEDMHRDPTAAITEDGDDEVDVDTADATHTGPLPPSLHAMMETIMMTQATYRQLLHGLLAKVAAFRTDVADYKRHVPPSPPSDSS
nr:hypothetical protein CFP56_56864 [Quercus suber]